MSRAKSKKPRPSEGTTSKKGAPKGSASKRCATDEGVTRTPRKSRASRWRVGVLITVHVLFALHLTHWLVAGKTVSPVEPSEAMYLLERGELNAGAIFFGVTLLLTALFGRFFCGWACHVVALQDLCAAWMKRVGVRPKLFRARLLMYVPLIIGLEMFFLQVFKQRVLARMIDDVDWLVWFDGIVKTERTLTNAVMTEGFWDTFAGPLMAIPFLFICGFGVVYFLGAKGFCTYGCPYGAFFAGMDRLAPGKIVANLDTCEKCGQCSAHCTSNVRVHEEIQDWGKVVSAGCMKCMDCVSVCPTHSLSFGFSKPLVFSRPLAGKKPKKKRYDLTLTEEIGLFVFFFATRYAWRGVYHLIPMLMATGIAACLTFLLWKTIRTFRDPDVSLHKFALKRAGELKPAGTFLRALTASLLLLTTILFAGKWSQEQAQWQYRRLDIRGATLDRAFIPGAAPIPAEWKVIAERGAKDQARLRTIGSGGIALLPQPVEAPTDPRLGYFRAIAGDFEGALAAWDRALDEDPSDELRDRYGQLVARLSFDASLSEDGSSSEKGTAAAIAILEKGFARVPESPLLASTLHLNYKKAGNEAEAEKWRRTADRLRRIELEELLALHTTNELIEAYVPLMHRLSVDAFHDEGPDAAIVIIRAALEFIPKSPFLAIQLHHLYTEKGEAAEAQKWKLIADQLQREAMAPPPPSPSPPTQP